MNFALILFVLVILTGIAWVADKLVFLPNRRRAADAAVTAFDEQQARVGERFADENAAQTRARLHDDKLRQPWWLEYTASFFPVILVVFVVRSFVVEPFKIPSGSMVPTSRRTPAKKTRSSSPRRASRAGCHSHAGSTPEKPR